MDGVELVDVVDECANRHRAAWLCRFHSVHFVHLVHQVHLGH
jgi:hypothetical protein